MAASELSQLNKSNSVLVTQTSGHGFDFHVMNELIRLK